MDQVRQGHEGRGSYHYHVPHLVTPSFPAGSITFVINLIALAIVVLVVQRVTLLSSSPFLARQRADTRQQLGGSHRSMPVQLQDRGYEPRLAYLSGL